MRAHAADLAKPTRMQAFAGHGDEPRTDEVAEVVTEFQGPGTEGSWMCERRQLERCRGVLLIKLNGPRGIVQRKRRTGPDHPKHRGFEVDAPARASVPGP